MTHGASHIPLAIMCDGLKRREATMVGDAEYFATARDFSGQPRYTQPNRQSLPALLVERSEREGRLAGTAVTGRSQVA